MGEPLRRSTDIIVTLVPRKIRIESGGPERNVVIYDVFIVLAPRVIESNHLAADRRGGGGSAPRR